MSYRHGRTGSKFLGGCYFLPENSCEKTFSSPSPFDENFGRYRSPKFSKLFCNPEF